MSHQGYVFVFRDETDQNFGRPRDAIDAIPWPRGRHPGGRCARIPRSLVSHHRRPARRVVYNNGLAFMDKEDVRDLCKKILEDALVVVAELDKLRQDAKKRDLALVSMAEHLLILSRGNDHLERDYWLAINDLGMICDRARSEGIYNQLYNGLELQNHPDDFDDL